MDQRTKYITETYPSQMWVVVFYSPPPVTDAHRVGVYAGHECCICGTREGGVSTAIRVNILPLFKQTVIELHIPQL